MIPVLFALCFVPPPVITENAIEREVINPSVMLQMPDEETKKLRSIGTGTVIRWKGKTYVLTCAHCVEPGKEVKVNIRIENGRQIKTEEVTFPEVTLKNERVGVQSVRTSSVVLYDEKLDLALLKPVSDKGLVPARLADRAIRLRPGEECWLSGAAYHDWNTQRGIVNRVLSDHVSVNAGVWFGHSGSALYVRRDKTWVIAGVVNRIYAVSSKAPGMAIPLKDVLTFLERVK